MTLLPNGRYQVDAEMGVVYGRRGKPVGKCRRDGYIWERSKTYQGIADALADQYGSLAQLTQAA